MKRLLAYLTLYETMRVCPHGGLLVAATGTQVTKFYLEALYATVSIGARISTIEACTRCFSVSTALVKLRWASVITPTWAYYHLRDLTLEVARWIRTTAIHTLELRFFHRDSSVPPGILTLVSRHCVIADLNKPPSPSALWIILV